MLKGTEHRSEQNFSQEVPMGFLRFAGLLAIIPATMFLTVSFFVLFAVNKSEQNGLKSFGKVIAVILWLCAALIFTGGLVSTAKGGPMHMMKHKMMMQGMSDDGCCPGMKGDKEEGKKTQAPVKK